MPKAAEEVIEELTKATIEAKETIRQLHEARATALDIDKKQKDRITKLIITEVENQTAHYSDDAKEHIRIAVEKVIEELTETLKERLKL